MPGIAFLLGIYNFTKNNWKLILYVITALVLAGVVFWLVNVIQQNAKDQVLIDQFKKNEQTYIQQLADKDEVIKILNEVTQLSNQVTQDKEAQLSDLEKKLNEIVTSNLGKDVNSPAADSLKELLKELKAQGF